MNPLALLVYGIFALSCGGPGVIVDGITTPSPEYHVTLNGTVPTSGGCDEDWR